MTSPCLLLPPGIADWSVWFVSHGLHRLDLAGAWTEEVKEDLPKKNRGSASSLEGTCDATMPYCCLLGQLMTLNATRSHPIPIPAHYSSAFSWDFKWFGGSREEQWCHPHLPEVAQSWVFLKLFLVMLGCCFGPPKMCWPGDHSSFWGGVWNNSLSGRVSIGVGVELHSELSLSGIEFIMSILNLAQLSNFLGSGVTFFEIFSTVLCPWVERPKKCWGDRLFHQHNNWSFMTDVKRISRKVSWQMMKSVRVGWTGLCNWCAPFKIANTLNWDFQGFDDQCQSIASLKSLSALGIC